jgi:Family of unknown function (DUF6982)
VKKRGPGSTLKKVVVLLLGRETLRGYLDAKTVGRSEVVDLLSPDGEFRSIPLRDIKSVYFVREFSNPFEPERKTFLSRPKIDGLWVRLRFRDEDVMEGIVANDLIELLDGGLRLTPPDLHGNVLHMFVPRTALAEVKVLGVVGAARRTRRATRDLRAVLDAQSKLFSE